MVELIMQLFQQIQGICMNLQALTEQVRASPGLTAAPGAAPSTQNQNPAPPTPPASAEYRTAIREEVRELAERDKRKHSVIIKGLSASTPRDMALKFKRLTSEVMDKAVEVTEVTAIPNHPQIFRAKILDDDNRNLVLEKAKYLKDTEDYKGVYISRDLTYAQRTALFNRRKAKKTGQGDTQEGAVGGLKPPSTAQATTGAAATVAAATPKN